MAFFFLMRPGKFCLSGQTSHPFRFCDVTLMAGSCRLDKRHATDAQLRAATFVTLTFTTQKSGVRGERVGHGRSGSTLACPVTALAELIIRLRRTHAPDATPLCMYQATPGSHVVPLRSTDFTNALRLEAALIGTRFGISPKDISVGCFRTTGAMALFCANVDSSRIRLLGRWNSWAMLRYLHMQANSIMSGFASKMLSSGTFSKLAADPPPDREPEAPDAPPVLLPTPDPST